MTPEPLPVDAPELLTVAYLISWPDDRIRSSGALLQFEPSDIPWNTCDELVRKSDAEAALVATFRAARQCPDHERDELHGVICAQAEEVAALRARLDVIARYSEWRRQDDEPYGVRTHLAFRVADGADLSCLATRRNAMNAAIDAHLASKQEKP